MPPEEQRMFRLRRAEEIPISDTSIDIHARPAGVEIGRLAHVAQARLS